MRDLTTVCVLKFEESVCAAQGFRAQSKAGRKRAGPNEQQNFLQWQGLANDEADSRRRGVLLDFYSASVILEHDAADSECVESGRGIAE
jgi:hypothetical protein